MTLIDKLSLVWEELEIHYKCLEWSSVLGVPECPDFSVMPLVIYKNSYAHGSVRNIGSAGAWGI